MIDPSKRYLVTAKQLHELKQQVLLEKVQSDNIFRLEEIINILDLITTEQELIEEEDLPGKVMYAYILKE